MASKVKYLDLTGTQKLKEELQEDASIKYVAKEKKTDSTTEYKVLSDNNLTNELVQKINDAGSSSFTGDYDDLTNKPSIGGVTIAAGDQTAASLGLATPTDITTAIGALDVTDTAATNQYVSTVSEADGKISVTRADLPVTAVSAATGTTDGTISVSVNGTATDVAVKGLGSAAYTESTAYDAAGAATTAETNAKNYADGLASNYDASGSATQALADAKSYTDTQVAAAVSSVYKIKGSCAFADLPTLTSAEVGDTYNITEAFTTTSDFVEGAGSSYPAGTNVVCVEVSGANKWDCLAGVFDMSSYVQSTDLVAITTAEIEAMFE